ncbi:MAG TPA: hypothetical protein VMW35_18530 [Myxococcota bacterium]|nr:hypothetical protein [Myxococcota bacterium]
MIRDAGRAARARVALFVALCVAAGARAGERPTAADFPLGTLRNVVRATAAPEEGDAVVPIAAAPGLRTVVRYTGTQRSVSRPARRVLSAFVSAAGPANEARARTFVAEFRDEIEVEEEGRRYWVPIQRGLDTGFHQEVGPNQEFTLACRYLGVTMPGPHPVCVMVGYFFQSPQRPARASCFARELGGVAIGAPLDETTSQLEAAHGPPVARPQNGAQRLATFALDADRSALLIVADAGLGHHQRVYSVQVSGPAASALPLTKELALGDPAAKVEAALGKPTRTVELPGEIQRWEWDGSPCSVAFQDGALTAAFVSDDPNYFAE